MIKSIIEDSNKQLLENSPNAHVIMFNTDIPLDSTNMETFKGRIENIQQEHGMVSTIKNLTIWYAQAGIREGLLSKSPEKCWFKVKFNEKQ